MEGWIRLILSWANNKGMALERDAIKAAAYKGIEEYQKALRTLREGRDRALEAIAEAKKELETATIHSNPRIIGVHMDKARAVLAKQPAPKLSPAPEQLPQDVPDMPEGKRPGAGE
jgi:hypothetical protein